MCFFYFFQVFTNAMLSDENLGINPNYPSFLNFLIELAVNLSSVKLSWYNPPLFSIWCSSDFLSLFLQDLSRITHFFPPIPFPERICESHGFELWGLLRASRTCNNCFTTAQRSSFKSVSSLVPAQMPTVVTKLHPEFCIPCASCHLLCTQ